MAGLLDRISETFRQRETARVDHWGGLVAAVAAGKVKPEIVADAAERFGKTLDDLRQDVERHQQLQALRDRVRNGEAVETLLQQNSDATALAQAELDQLAKEVQARRETLQELASDRQRLQQRQYHIDAARSQLLAETTTEHERELTAEIARVMQANPPASAMMNQASRRQAEQQRTAALARIAELRAEIEQDQQRRLAAV